MHAKTQKQNSDDLQEKPKCSLDLEACLNPLFRERKIPSIPMEFEDGTVDILSKEFTKLNNPHEHRIYYLGWRFTDTEALHKRCAFNVKNPFVNTPIPFTQGSKTNSVRNADSTQTPHSNSEQVRVQKYNVEMKSIVKSFSVEESFKKTKYYQSSVFYRAFEGMNPSIDTQKDFVFDSLFEGGNLDCVIKRSDLEFDIFPRIDSNTRGHQLWFYFSIRNKLHCSKIKLNIFNFSKSKNLYREGMKPYVYSRKKSQLEGEGWHQGGWNLGLEKKVLDYEVLEGKLPSNKQGEIESNCLTFEYQFCYENDEVFFSYCIPYTYSQLLYELKLLPASKVRRYSLGKSLLGVDIPLIHVGGSSVASDCSLQKKIESTSCVEPSENENQSSKDVIVNSDQNFQTAHLKIGKKKVILITGRIHPSESNSSYVLMGFVRWLCSKEADFLTDFVDFVIVPMVNPDGVIIGNSRTSAAGKDLNREYIGSDWRIFPEVQMVKHLASQLHRQAEVSLFLDFHGHSRKKNTFFYGPVYGLGDSNYCKCRILPKIIESISNPFRYHSCSFNIVEDKKSTARAYMFEELGIQYTYTVESSIGFFYDSQQMKIFQFSETLWLSMGESIAKGTASFMKGLIEYEALIDEKRQIRRAKYKNYQSFMKTPPNKDNFFLEDNLFTVDSEKAEILKIEYPSESKAQKKVCEGASNPISETNNFMAVLNQVRKGLVSPSNKSHNKESKGTGLNNGVPQFLDEDQDSDSHDEAKDLDNNRLADFRGYVTKAAVSDRKVQALAADYDVVQKKQAKSNLKARNSKKQKFKQQSSIRNIENDLFFYQRTQEPQQLKRVTEGPNRTIKEQKEEFEFTDHRRIQTAKRQTSTVRFVGNPRRDVHSSNKSRDHYLKSSQKMTNYFGEYILQIDNRGNNPSEEDVNPRVAPQTSQRSQRIQNYRKVYTRRQNANKAQPGSIKLTPKSGQKDLLSQRQVPNDSTIKSTPRVYVFDFSHAERAKNYGTVIPDTPETWNHKAEETIRPSTVQIAKQKTISTNVFLPDFKGQPNEFKHSPAMARFKAKKNLKSRLNSSEVSHKLFPSNSGFQRTSDKDCSMTSVDSVFPDKRPTTSNSTSNSFKIKNEFFSKQRQCQNWNTSLCNSSQRIDVQNILTNNFSMKDKKVYPAGRAEKDNKVGHYSGKDKRGGKSLKKEPRVQCYPGTKQSATKIIDLASSQNLGHQK